VLPEPVEQNVNAFDQLVLVTAALALDARAAHPLLLALIHLLPSLLLQLRLEKAYPAGFGLDVRLLGARLRCLVLPKLLVLRFGKGLNALGEDVVLIVLGVNSEPGPLDDAHVVGGVVDPLGLQPLRQGLAIMVLLLVKSVSVVGLELGLVSNPRYSTNRLAHLADHVDGLALIELVNVLGG